MSQSETAPSLMIQAFCRQDARPLSDITAPLVFNRGLRAIASRIETGDVAEARKLATAMGLTFSSVKRAGRITPTILRVVAS